MKNVLVIDDDLELKDMMVEMISREGYNAHGAGDGKEALKLINEKSFDLIITDIIMPEKEGIEMIIELKKKQPELKIIAISGGGKLGPEGYLDLASKLGADATFTKPVSRSELLEEIEKLIG